MSVVTRVRIGFSAAIFTTLVIVEMVAASGINIRQRGGAFFCGALALLGFLVWVTSPPGKVQLDPEAPPGPAPPEHPLAPFMGRRFWGKLLMLSAIVLAGASAYRYTQPRPKPPPPALPAPQTKPPVVFPPLKLEGIIVHGTQSSAQINGQLVHLGEDIHGVRLVGVDAEHAVVELQGQTNVLTLSK